MKIEYRPIGIVHSPFKKRDSIPSRPSRGKGVSGRVEVFPEFAEGLDDLDGFSHIILLCHFHRSAGYRLKIVPRRETELRGLFSTRSPRRPNPIGLSIVRLLGIHENGLSIVDLDIIDETPVLDIKPYYPELEEGEAIRTGWLERKGGKGRPTKNRFDLIYDLVRTIPSGRVVSYGQIADRIGHCTPRMVGFAMAALPHNSDVPWHRVINGKGMISERSGGDGASMQRVLLEAEGVGFDQSGRVDKGRFLGNSKSRGLERQ